LLYKGIFGVFMAHYLFDKLFGLRTGHKAKR